MKLTAKQRVKKRFPNAYALQGMLTSLWHIYATKGGKYYDIASAPTAKTAWEAAAAQIKVGIGRTR